MKQLVNGDQQEIEINNLPENKKAFIEFVKSKTGLSSRIILNYILTDPSKLESSVKHEFNRFSHAINPSPRGRNIAYYFANACIVVRGPRKWTNKFITEANYAQIISNIIEGESKGVSDQFIKGVEVYSVFFRVMNAVIENKIPNQTAFLKEIDDYITENEFSIFNNPIWLSVIADKYIPN